MNLIIDQHYGGHWTLGWIMMQFLYSWVIFIICYIVLPLAPYPLIRLLFKFRILPPPYHYLHLSMTYNQISPPTIITHRTFSSLSPKPLLAFSLLLPLPPPPGTPCLPLPNLPLHPLSKTLLEISLMISHWFCSFFHLCYGMFSFCVPTKNLIIFTKQ